MTVQFLEQLWPLGCMSVSAAPEQMCQPKSMNFVRKMYVGTRIPSVEPHGLARGFSQERDPERFSKLYDGMFKHFLESFNFEANGIYRIHDFTCADGVLIGRKMEFVFE